MNNTITFNTKKYIITIYLNRTEGRKPIFTVSALVKAIGEHEIIACGQCRDEVYAILKRNRLFKEIYELWEKHHLNNMHAGTERQEETLKLFKTEYKKEHKVQPSYKEQCDYLAEHNLLIDNGYKYGSSWLYRPIPKQDLKRIDALLKFNHRERNVLTYGTATTTRNN
jgi:hypothetical protein